jgi:hypothetical protein
VYGYQVSSASAAVGDIAPAPLTVSLTNTGVTKGYDGSTTASFTPTYGVTGGLVSGDTAASFSVTGKDYNSSHVTLADRVSVSGLAVSSITGSNGSLASDYSVALTLTSAPGSAAITPALITATLTNTGVTKVYDSTPGAAAIASYSVAGQLGTDTVNVSTGSLNYNTSHVVGSDYLVASGLTVGGVTGSTFASASLASDYALSSATATSAPGSATITPALVTATLTNTGVTKVYDGTTGSAPVASYSVAGQLGTDTVNVSTGSLNYNTSHVLGSDHLVASGLTVGSVSGSTFASASLASDYSVAITTTGAPGSAAITVAPLTVRANDASRPAALPNPTFSASYSGLQAGDSPASLTGSVVYATLANVGSPAGSYLITPSGVSSPDYSIVFVNGALTVFGTTAVVPDPLATAHNVLHSPIATGAVSLSTPSGRGIYAAGKDDEPGAEFLNGLPATAAGLSEGDALAPIDACNSSSPMALLRCAR